MSEDRYKNRLEKIESRTGGAGAFTFIMFEPWQAAIMLPPADQLPEGYSLVGGKFPTLRQGDRIASILCWSPPGTPPEAETRAALRKHLKAIQKKSHPSSSTPDDDTQE